MSPEMLKRLDAFIERYGNRKVYFQTEDTFALGVDTAWAALRAELVAERCENCVHWEPLEVSESTAEYEAWADNEDDLRDPPVHPRNARPKWETRRNARCCARLTDRDENHPTQGLVSTYDGGHVAEETWTEPDFCCSNFAKKESAP